jgi:hypothetical protein
MATTPRKAAMGAACAEAMLVCCKKFFLTVVDRAAQQCQQIDSPDVIRPTTAVFVDAYDCVEDAAEDIRSGVNGEDPLEPFSSTRYSVISLTTGVLTD